MDFVPVSLGFLLALLIIDQVIGAYEKYVTCGSSIKLLNTNYQVRLHSHDIKYGTGSGQQSITGTEIQDDVNSFWLIKDVSDWGCARGTPITCGATIRLEHVQTRKNLHSHYFNSPLSGNQEVSGYGEDGVGDTGDTWEVVCSGGKWGIKDNVMFKHKDTGAYLAASGQTYGRPINGQMEIMGQRSSNGAVQWQAKDGVFLHSPEPLTNQIRDEL